MSGLATAILAGLAALALVALLVSAFLGGAR